MHSDLVRALPIYLVLLAAGLPLSQLMTLTSFTAVNLAMLALLFWAVLVTIIGRDGIRLSPIGNTFKQPAVICLLVYFASGLPFLLNLELAKYQTDVAIRLSFAIIPVFICAMVPTGAAQTVRALFLHMFACLILSIWCLMEGAGTGFSAAAGGYGVLHKNTLGSICNSGFLCAFGFFLALKPLKFKVPLIVAASIMALGLFSTHSRGAILASATGIFCIFLIRRVALVKQLAISGAASILLLAFSLLIPEERMAERTKFSEDSSAGARTYFWKIAVDYILSNQYHPVGWGRPYVKVSTGEPFTQINNTFLQDVIEVGFLGALADIGILVFALWQAYKNSVTLPGDSPLRAVNAIAAGIVIGRYTHGLVDSMWSPNLMLGLFFAVGLILNVAVYQKQRT